MTDERDYATTEQLIYAKWLDFGTKAGFLALVVTFVVHVFGLMPPSLALEHLPLYWHLPVDEFIALTGAPQGWAWVARLGEADILNFIGVTILASVSAVCYARLVPLFLRVGERTLAWICLAEIAVLAAAASGLAVGH